MPETEHSSVLGLATGGLLEAVCAEAMSTSRRGNKAGIKNFMVLLTPPDYTTKRNLGLRNTVSTGGLYDVLDERKIGFSVEPHGFSFPYPIECTGDGALAERASATGLAARQIFWRGALSGSEAHHAHAGFAHGLRERALPEHGRVLGTWHRDVYDSGRHLHARLRILRRAFGQARWPPG